MQRSILSQFLVLLRKRRGYSVNYMANRLKMSALEFVMLEESPETVSMSELHAVFEELKIENEEYMDLSILIHHLQSAVREELRRENTTDGGTISGFTGQNILDLYASKKLNLIDILGKEDVEC